MMHRSILLIALAFGSALPAHADGAAIKTERIRKLAILWLEWHRAQCPALYTLTDEGLTPRWGCDEGAVRQGGRERP